MCSIEISSISIYVSYVTSKYTNFKIVLHTAHALMPVQLRNNVPLHFGGWPCELADRRSPYTYIGIYVDTYVLGVYHFG